MSRNRQGDNSTNVQIGSVGAGAIVQVAPLSSASPPPRLVLDPVAPRSYPAGEVNRAERLSMVAMSLALLGAISDVIGVSTFFGFPRGCIIGVTFLIAAVVLVPHWKVLFIKLRRGNRQDPEWYLGNGRMARQDADGALIVYLRQGPCDYPNCKGTVSLRDAPPREKERHRYIGSCSHDSRHHTYIIDFLGNMTRAQFDWRAPDPPPKK